jgi:hypothetical protein
LSVPSPGPICFGKFDAVVLPPPLLLDDDLSSLDEPQPAAIMAATVTRANVFLPVMRVLLLGQVKRVVRAPL